MRRRRPAGCQPARLRSKALVTCDPVERPLTDVAQRRPIYALMIVTGSGRAATGLTPIAVGTTSAAIGQALPRVQPSAVPAGAQRRSALRTWAPTTRCSTWATAPDSNGSGRVSRTGRIPARSVPDAIPKLGERPTCASTATAAGRVKARHSRRGRSTIDRVTLELRATEAGQVGLFPEHAAMLPWLRARVAERTDIDVGSEAQGPPAVLHLFAYTGLATLAMAAGGRRGRRMWTPLARPSPGRGATRPLSGLDDRPIRWIVDDAAGIRRARGTARASLCRHGPRPAELWPRTWATCVADRARTCAGLLERALALLDRCRVRPPHGPHDGLRCRRGSRPRSARAFGAAAAELEAGDLELTTPGRTATRARRLRALGRRGMMVAMPSPTPARPDQPRQPAGQGGRALRDRRERDRTGLTLVDGAREVRRALDAGVEVVEAFVCEPLLAGAGCPCGARRCCGPAASTIQSTSEPVFAKLAFGERAEGIVAVVRVPSLELSAARAARATRWSRSSRASRSPATSGPSCAAPMGPGVDAVVAASPRTDLFNPNAIRASAGTVFGVPTRGGLDGGRPGLAARARPADRGGAGRRRAARTPTST